MDKTLQLLSLIKKANKLITGEEFVTDAIRKNKIYLVFLASDAGVNTTKKITDKTKFYHKKECRGSLYFWILSDSIIFLSLYSSILNGISIPNCFLRLLI